MVVRPVVPLVLMAALLPLASHWPWRAVAVGRHAVGTIIMLPRDEDCRLIAAEPPAAIKPRPWADGGLGLEVLGPGVVRLRCAGGLHRYQLVAPRSLRVLAPAKVPAGERFDLRMEALDEHGAALELGYYAHREWELAPPLRFANQGSCEFPPWCGSPPVGGTYAIGERPGPARALVRFGGLTAEATFAVTGGAR